jgi:hypothetical protein
LSCLLSLPVLLDSLLVCLMQTFFNLGSFQKHLRKERLKSFPLTAVKNKRRSWKNIVKANFKPKKFFNVQYCSYAWTCRSSMSYLSISLMYLICVWYLFYHTSFSCLTCLECLTCFTCLTNLMSSWSNVHVLHILFIFVLYALHIFNV